MNEFIPAIPDGPYALVREVAHQRNERLLEISKFKGGPSDPYRPMYNLHERVLAEHVPASETRGEPCAECGQVWPCGMVRSLFADD